MLTSEYDAKYDTSEYDTKYDTSEWWQMDHSAGKWVKGEITVWFLIKKGFLKQLSLVDWIQQNHLDHLPMIRWGSASIHRFQIQSNSMICHLLPSSHCAFVCPVPVIESFSICLAFANQCMKGETDMMKSKEWRANTKNKIKNESSPLRWHKQNSVEFCNCRLVCAAGAHWWVCCECTLAYVCVAARAEAAHVKERHA